MSNSNNIPEAISINDLYDLATLANSDMDWMQTAINDTSRRIKEIKQNLNRQNPNAQYHFYELEKVLEMYLFIADTRTQHYVEEVQRIELFANKKGGAI